MNRDVMQFLLSIEMLLQANIDEGVTLEEWGAMIRLGAMFPLGKELVEAMADTVDGNQPLAEYNTTGRMLIDFEMLSKGVWASIVWHQYLGNLEV